MSFDRRKQSEELVSAVVSTTEEKSSWIKKIRDSSRKRFLKSGIPIQSDEEWRLSNPKMFTNANITYIDAKIEGVISPFDELTKFVLVFVNGVYSEKESSFSNGKGVEINFLGSPETETDHWAKEHYGKLEEESQEISNKPLAAFNSAFANAGVLINVKDDLSVPIELKYISRGDSPKALIRNCIKIESNKRMTFIEHFECGGWSNILTELYLEENASIAHLRFESLPKKSVLNSSVIAKLERKSKFQSNSLSVGLGNSRNECHVILNGEFSSTSISGASYLDNGKTLNDDTISVHHLEPHCKSRQVFKKVLMADSIGVFQGKIRVEKEAQKTDGYQSSRAILLQDSGKFFAKPELEIFADDVSCSHGSVSGSIDLESMFYLQSRGIDEQKAKNILILAFLDEVFDEVEDHEIKDKIKDYMSNLLKV